MTTSDLTPEQAKILFGDSDAVVDHTAASTSAHAPVKSTLTDEEYMILFGDTMKIDLMKVNLRKSAADEDDQGARFEAEEAESDHVETEQSEETEPSPTTWTAPQHLKPQHLAPQHSADEVLEKRSDYVGNRFAEPISSFDDDATKDDVTWSNEVDETEPGEVEASVAASQTAPVPESTGLVDRLVSRVKQRLTDELDSSDH